MQGWGLLVDYKSHTHTSMSTIHLCMKMKNVRRDGVERVTIPKTDRACTYIYIRIRKHPVMSQAAFF